MIHFTQEGAALRLGLNLFRARGGFVVIWLWFNFPTHQATQWRFRLRLHKAPRIMFEKRRFNVIDNFLLVRNMSMVHEEVLHDLKESEQDIQHISERYARIKPLRQ